MEIFETAENHESCSQVGAVDTSLFALPSCKLPQALSKELNKFTNRIRNHVPWVSPCCQNVTYKHVRWANGWGCYNQKESCS